MVNINLICRKKSKEFFFFLGIITINAISIALAVHFYPEKFKLDYPLSYASMTQSFALGLPNRRSEIIYAVGMFLSGLIMAGFTIYRTKNNESGLNGVLLPAVCAFGFFVAAFSPNDIKHTTHVLGSALFVATFWIMATSYLFSLRKSWPNWKYWMLQAILQIPIFAYAIAYFLDLGLVPNYLQKPAFLVLLLVLLYCAPDE